ncbi:MAG TPA: tripartite tricarboxylate transporter substrate binding protein [Alphaproteobacteria bacterium]
MRRIASGVVLAAGIFAASDAAALDYPTRPIRVICPFPAGATADISARLVAQMLNEATGQPAVVENRSGAAGNIGADLAAKADPDGYTLLVSPPPPFAVNISLYKQLPYDPKTSFAPISIVVQSASVLVANPNRPYHTLKELIAYAKANPGKVNYASQGSGTTSHLTAEMMKQVAKLDIVHIPYKGSSPAVADLLGGQVDIMWDNLGSSMSHIQDKSFLALAVGSEKRSAELPDVPTMLEQGYPGFLSTAWFAAAAPARTPPEIVEKISAIIRQAVHKPELVKRLGAIGIEPVGSTPQEMAKFVGEEIERWRNVIKTAGIQPE